MSLGRFRGPGPASGPAALLFSAGPLRCGPRAAGAGRLGLGLRWVGSPFPGGGGGCSVTVSGGLWRPEADERQLGAGRTALTVAGCSLGGQGRRGEHRQDSARARLCRLLPPGGRRWPERAARASTLASGSRAERRGGRDLAGSGGPRGLGRRVGVDSRGRPALRRAGHGEARGAVRTWAALCRACSRARGG